MTRTITILVMALILGALGVGCSSHEQAPRRTEVRLGEAASSMRGTASWYGEQYAGRATASGELFDPSALTAAHPNLKFGTRVRVTSQTTGKSVVVRINDRFGGHKGRIIDLSKASFESIVPLAKGVDEVTLEVLAD